MLQGSEDPSRRRVDPVMKEVSTLRTLKRSKEAEIVLWTLPGVAAAYSVTYNNTAHFSAPLASSGAQGASWHTLTGTLAGQIQYPCSSPT